MGDSGNKFYVHKMQSPTMSEWRCEITSTFHIIPLKGHEPNAFHRLMQRLILGFKWRKALSFGKDCK